MIGKQYGTGDLIHRQVKPIIIVENMIHRIININHLLIITNATIIFVIEQNKNPPIELIIIRKKRINVALLIVEYLHLTKIITNYYIC